MVLDSQCCPFCGRKMVSTAQLFFLDLKSRIVCVSCGRSLKVPARWMAFIGVLPALMIPIGGVLAIILFGKIGMSFGFVFEFLVGAIAGCLPLMALYAALMRFVEDV